MLLNRQVQGNGPLRGIMVLGEAPGEVEVQKSVPFVGPAGRVIRRCLNEAKIDPKNVRFENVVERKLEYNDERVLYHHGNRETPAEELLAWYSDLKRRIELVQPRVIIACGDTALRAITGFNSIGYTHCYVVPSTVTDCPVVPAYHPAYILRSPEAMHWLTWACVKARKVIEGERDPQHHLYTKPRLSGVLNFLKKCKEVGTIAVDIEKTMSDHRLTTLGIATSAEEAMSISMDPSHWEGDQFEQIWAALVTLMADVTVTKIFHNYIFDCMFMEHVGMSVNGTIEDTMLMAHALNPELPKGLADMARLYCFCPPWKEKHDWSNLSEQLRKYNARDCARTYQVWESQMKELEVRGLYDLYVSRYKPLMHMVLRTCNRGIRVDMEALAAVQEDVRRKLEALSADIAEIAQPHLCDKIEYKIRRGKPKPDTTYYRELDPENVCKTNPKCFLEIDPGVIAELAQPKKKLAMYPGKVYERVESHRDFNPNSPLQLKDVLKSMGIRIPTRRGKESTDTESLLKIQLKHPDNELIPMMMEYSKLATIEENYCKMRLDDDGRFRFSLNIAGTKSGRFNSSETPWGTGRNGQNMPSGRKGVQFKQVFIPDEGKKLIQVDLSQAELRVVAWLADEEQLIELLESGKDVHQYTADQVKRVTGVEVSRPLGKMLNHAANYGMGARKFASACLVQQGIVITELQAQQLLEARRASFPKIVAWQKAIEKKIMKDRWLESPHGRRRSFFGRMYADYSTKEINAALVNEALSFIPQATVVDALNEAWYNLEYLAGDRIDVLQQGHDSILLQCKENEVPNIIEIINLAFKDVSFGIGDRQCRIPWDIQVGDNWRDLKEIK